MVRSWSSGSPRTTSPPTAPQPKPSTESCSPVRPNSRSSIAVPPSACWEGALLKRASLAAATTTKKSALPGEPGAHGARRRSGLAITIIQSVLVDEAEDVSPFLVRSHHELTVRRESAPELLILIAGRFERFKCPTKVLPCCCVMI